MYYLVNPDRHSSSSPPCVEPPASVYSFNILPNPFSHMRAHWRTGLYVTIINTRCTFGLSGMACFCAYFLVYSILPLPVASIVSAVPMWCTTQYWVERIIRCRILMYIATVAHRVVVVVCTPCFGRIGMPIFVPCPAGGHY